jgi:citrate lyase beta subunit
MKLTLTGPPLAAIHRRLVVSNARFPARYPGDRLTRQPVHTVYGGAHLFKAGSPAKLGTIALRALGDYAGSGAGLAAALGLEPTAGDALYERIRAKLTREPVEDYRIDFEDGYGHRTDGEEDGHAAEAAHEVAKAAAENRLPAGIGIRIKPFSDESRARGLRTLDGFVTALADATSGRIPDGFVVTLPKITAAAQVSALADALEALEDGLGLARGVLKLELMVETPQAILDEHGTCPLLQFVDAARGRATAVHFGAYDYLALLGVTAAHQHLLHPACDAARQVMQVALAGSGLWLSDGATNIMPIPAHKAREGARLSATETAENRATVHRSWQLHFRHVSAALVAGFYQGWDLHPAQLPVRYAAVYAFFRSGVADASARLRHFIAENARATLAGGVFDDAATGQGLLNYFLRALASGAIAEPEAVELSGLTTDELRTRSFARILEGRRPART